MHLDQFEFNLINNLSDIVLSKEQNRRRHGQENNNDDIEPETEVTYDEIVQLLPVLTKLIKASFTKIKTAIKNKKDNQTAILPVINTLVEAFKSNGFRLFLDITKIKFSDFPGRFRAINFTARNTFIFMRTVIFNRKLGRVFGEHNDILRSVAYMMGFTYMASYGAAEVMHSLIQHRTTLEQFDKVEDAIEYVYAKLVPDLLDMFVKYGLSNGLGLIVQELQAKEVPANVAANLIEKIITGFVSALAYTVMHYGYGVYTGVIKIQQVEPSNRFIAWSKIIRRSALFD